MANYVSFYKETVMKIYAILFDMVRKNYASNPKSDFSSMKDMK